MKYHPQLRVNQTKGNNSKSSYHFCIKRNGELGPDECWKNFSQKKVAILSGLFCGVSCDRVAASSIERRPYPVNPIHSHMASFLYSLISFLFSHWVGWQAYSLSIHPYTVPLKRDCVWMDGSAESANLPIKEEKDYNIKKESKTRPKQKIKVCCRLYRRTGVAVRNFGKSPVFFRCMGFRTLAHLAQRKKPHLRK